VDVVQYLEKKSENNPKDVAKGKRDERRQQRALKEKEKEKEKAKAKKKKGISDEKSQMKTLCVVTWNFNVFQEHLKSIRQV
jgi:hypothetical protein